MKTKTALLALGCSFLIACSGGGSDDGATGTGDGPADGTSTEVAAEITAFQFEPNPLEIKTGTTVEWTNNDNIDHTVTSGEQREQGVPGVSGSKDAKPDGVFRGVLAQKNETFSFTFDEAGTFAYFCEIHAGMTGEVIVTN
jgi:plastocyanin